MAPVRLYYISTGGTTCFIECDIDENLSEDEYLQRWAKSFGFEPASLLVTGQTRVYSSAVDFSRYRWGRIDWRDKGMSRVCENMRSAVKLMPKGAPYAVLFVNAEDWNTTQRTIAQDIVKEQYKQSGLLSPVVPDPTTTTKKPVRVYMCHSGGRSAMVEYQPDEVAVDDELARKPFKCQLPLLDAGWFVVPTTIAVPGEEQGVNHYDDLVGNPGFAGALNRAITLAACCCPNRAPYSIAFLRGYGIDLAMQIVKEWRASFSDKYMAPQPEATTPAPVDPLMEWYTLNKQTKAAEDALLAKLKEALVEKAKDPVLNPKGVQFDDTAESLLEVLSASTDNIALIDASVRYAAYEACGIRFGPALAAAPLRLSTLDAVSTLPWQVRMTDLPWVSKEQK